MKYLVEIPEEVEQALEERASATGDNVVHLIEMAVVSFVRSEAQSSLAGRRPDQPLNSVETVAPCDLPRTAPRPTPIRHRSQRRLDPIADSA